MTGVRTKVNRVLLTLAGLLLVVAGGATLAVGLGLKPPSWWIYDDRHEVLLTGANRTRWRDEGWWWPVVIAVLAVLLLLALWWLSAELRRHRLAVLAVDTGDGDGAEVRGRAVEDALGDEAERLPGVDRARVLLRGRRDSPEVRAGLRLEPAAGPRETLECLVGRGLRNARGSLGRDELPAEVVLKAARHKAERVS
ncbi:MULTISPECIES: alkaline shock response membrane anchor protein AmaP [Streptomyces]|uniref:Alkaline shock response membrane anchor protein AmaP n=1 Tax=Streptomyces fungicidicus TaxID=68203 RepID=A0ACC7XZ73_9ACTN|nr:MULTISPECIES: alkaline shock response membrane anchor protein AmaP [Streptomyces]MBF4137207.1 alkaline shock response membrane anchor protein AmaP [Streptomyces albidoflavus]NUV74855.1 alkaline shock response membrane anchor protein AmaP [Streptomyces fungicidicus]PAX83417.1 alkaline shock response membrane anchor protein AmaP [Streptomyces albidoflavus]PAX86676.1 alkaline shock response membrane anchor protein AmaP [Streptomyces albidoflavus]PBO16099.1 alkaline shock response membrane anch